MPGTGAGDQHGHHDEASGADGERREERHGSAPRWEMPAGPAGDAERRRAAVRGQIPVVDTLREAASLVNQNRGTVLLPLLAVTFPVALVISILTVVLFLTAWSDEALVSTATITEQTPAPIVFTLLVFTAVEVLFAQVARAAAIVAIAGAAAGKRTSLAEALDPAFNKIGGILVLIGVFIAGFFLGVLTIVGLIIVPYLFLRIAVSLEAYMLDGGSIWNSFGRSWAVMQGNMLRLLGLLLLTGACVLPVIVLVSLLGGSIEGDRTTELVMFAGWSLAQAIILIPIVALFTACTTLYYLKARAIHDGRGPA